VKQPIHRVFEPGTAGRSGAPPSWAWTLSATVALAIPAVLAGLSRVLTEWASWDRARVASGEFWRVVTGHWTHWSLEHLAWDLVAFVVLLPLCLRIGRGRTALALIGATLAIPLAVGAALPEIVAYRGLSGLDSALFTCLASSLLLRELREGAWGTAMIFGGALMAFAMKVAFELATGSALFVESDAFVPVVLAHLVGGSWGVFAALAGRAIGSGLPRWARSRLHDGSSGVSALE
jgi:rhomboid family GlyGly-CTERM serine protease